MCSPSSTQNQKNLTLQLKFCGPVLNSTTLKDRLRCGVLLKDDAGSRRGCLKCLELRLQLDPLLACILWRELHRSVAFRVRFSVWLFNQWRRRTWISANTRRFNASARTDLCSITRIRERRSGNSEGRPLCRFLVYTELLPSAQLCMVAVARWSNMLMCILTHYAQLQYVLAWLSTLGGAYSALGDCSMQSSHKAGKISGHQLVIASRLGNPVLAAQCKVYFALSLIQRGLLKDAKAIVREQFKFAVSTGGNRDGKLMSSCKSAWNRIRYMKRQKKVGRMDNNSHSLQGLFTELQY